jgi:hypothetical protein
MFFEAFAAISVLIAVYIHYVAPETGRWAIEWERDVTKHTETLPNDTRLNVIDVRF